MPYNRTSGTQTNDVKRAVTTVALVVLGPALAAGYDIDAYCRRASAQSLEECRNTEREARDALARRRVSGRILERCEKKAEDAGGSYRVKADCIEEEIEILRFLDD